MSGAGNLFIIGYSGSGKSTLAQRIAALRGMQCVSAGQWAREQYLGEHEDSTGMREHITAYAVAVLRSAPRTAVAWIKAHVDLAQPTVVEGVRNPSDFAHLFRPDTDDVIRLVHRGAAAATSFDLGVDVIDAHLRWMIETRLLDQWRYEVQEFDDHAEIRAC